MDVMKIYNRLPVSLQNAAVSAEGGKIQASRYGREFREAYALWKGRENWSLGEAIRYRDRQLRGIVRYSYDHVPFYRKQLDECGIAPEEVRSLGDLSKLPIIDKETVRNNYGSFLSDEYEGKRLRTGHTSGSTGAGLIVKGTSGFDARNWASVWVEHNKIGVTRDMWCGYFGGRPIVPPGQRKPPFYRINRPGRQIMFSSFHMNDANMGSYVDALDKYQPPWIHGYPSSVSLLASFMNRNGLRLGYPVKVITLCSENVMEQQAREIERAFGVRPHQTYGQTEGVACFRDYTPGEIYVVEYYSAVEFVKMGDGETHVVGTNFNRAMPLIRYDTHDIAECAETPKGRLVTSIDGRAEDYVTTRDGSKIGRLDHIFKDLGHVVEAQIVQKKEGDLEIRVVRSPAYTSEDEKMIVRLADERLKGRVDYSIAYVDGIERGKNGKLRFVVSEMG